MDLKSQSMAMLRRNYRTKRLPPLGLGKQVILSHYVDVNLYHNVLTGRSVTGVLHFLNGTPIDWYSKKQATVESATNGSEFVAARTWVEQIIDLGHTLRYLGVPEIKMSQMLTRRRRRRTWQKMKLARSGGSCSSTALILKNKPLQVLALEEVEEEEYSVRMQIPSGYESSLLPSANLALTKQDCGGVQEYHGIGHLYQLFAFFADN
jgi:hypothetical protein